MYEKNKKCKNALLSENNTWESQSVALAGLKK